MKIFIFLLIFSDSLFASCVGLSGQFLEQCHCEMKFFKEKGPPEIAYQCRIKSDCIVVEGPCSDWIILNKSWVKKANYKSPNNLPSILRDKKPKFKCDKVNKQSRCIVNL